MLIYLLLCIPTTVYSQLSCKESCDACVANENPPEVQKVYCSMCLECRSQRSGFEADLMLQESQFEANPRDAGQDITDDNHDPEVTEDHVIYHPDCPGGKCIEHSKEADPANHDNTSDNPDLKRDTTMACPTQNCPQNVGPPTICITIPQWMFRTETTTQTTTTKCETTCKAFTECGGCGRRDMEYRRAEPPEVYVAFPKGTKADSYVYKKLKRAMRPDYM